MLVRLEQMTFCNPNSTLIYASQYTRADLIGYHRMCPTGKMMFSSMRCISRQIGTMHPTLDVQIMLFRHFHVATTLHKYCKSTTCGVLMPDKFRALILTTAAHRSPYSSLGRESLTTPDQMCLQMQTRFSCSRDNSADSMTYLKCALITCLVE